MLRFFRLESGSNAFRFIVEPFEASVQRGEEQINVPVQAEQFLYAAEFLRHLSLRQAWVEELAPASELNDIFPGNRAPARSPEALTSP